MMLTKSLHGIPIVLSAASGTGKTTLSRHLLRLCPDWRLSISHTTRAPRGREVDGEDYHFVDEATFRQGIERGDFVEWAEVHDNFYGSSAAATERILEQGLNVLFDIDVQGGEQLQQRFPNTVLIWLDAPSWSELEKRLRGRGTDTEEVIQKRLHNARTEQQRAQLSFQYFVLNDDIDRAVAEIITIVHRAQEQAQGSVMSPD